MPLTKHLRVAIIDSNPALKSRGYLKKDGVPDSRVGTVTPATISFFRGKICKSKNGCDIFLFQVRVLDVSALYQYLELKVAVATSWSCPLLVHLGQLSPCSLPGCILA
jgi:hypothetical protein